MERRKLEMKKIGFVVLHYNSEVETKNCVNSILQHVPDSYIVVVDNASPNNSGKNLMEFYKTSYVKVICLKSNVGFASGNNVGIEYLKTNTGVEFVVLLNNDTLLKQDDFQKIVIDTYIQEKYAVMGPQIITKNGKNTSNPVEYIVDSKEKINKLLLKRKIKLFLNQIHLNILLNNSGEGQKNNKIYNPNLIYENVKLHGACWVLSPIFFQHFNGLCNKTFLYFEEDILYLQLRKVGIKSVYNPELQIIHLEDVSTNSIVNNNREKNIFVLKNEIRSLKVLKKMFDEKNKEHLGPVRWR